MTDNIELPTVPARVGKLKIIETGPVPTPMRWQRWHSTWEREDMDVRYVGTCIVCERNLYAGGSGDPRGPLGDNTYSPIDELKVRTCAICANDGDSYRQAQRIIERDGVEACAPIAWPQADPAEQEDEENWITYTVIRRFEDDDIDPMIIETGLSLEEAQAHCSDPQTSSSTATDPDKVELTQQYGRWFDSYNAE